MIKFRKVQSTDCGLLFDLANESSVRRNSFNSGYIELDIHVNWFQQKLRSSDCVILIFELVGNNEFVGAVRFERDVQQATISVSLTGKYQGKGFGTIVINQATSYYKELTGLPILAMIKTSNLASIKSFRKCNYIENHEIVSNSPDIVTLINKM